MPADIKSRVVDCLRSELANNRSLDRAEVDAIIDELRIHESAPEHQGRVSFQLSGEHEDLLQRPGVDDAIVRAIHACGYGLWGEE